MSRQRLKPRPTQQRLRELFDYHPDGYFVRRLATGTKTYVGQIVRGAKGDPRGYLRIKVDGLDVYLHQAVFLWHHGHWPKMIDHDDRNKCNNRIGNLLASDAQANGNNRGPTVRSQTLVKGVFPEGQRFLAQRTVRGKAHYLGLHDTVEEAEQTLRAFDEARSETE